TRSMLRKLVRLEAWALRRATSDSSLLGQIRQDAAQILIRAGMTPDSWQRDLLLSNASRTLLLCSRQAGKSTVAAALALRVALLRPRSPVLLLSPSQRQSGELYRKVLDLFRASGVPLVS